MLTCIWKKQCQTNSRRKLNKWKKKEEEWNSKDRTNSTGDLIIVQVKAIDFLKVHSEKDFVWPTIAMMISRNNIIYKEETKWNHKCTQLIQGIFQVIEEPYLDSQVIILVFGLKEINHRCMNINQLIELKEQILNSRFIKMIPIMIMVSSKGIIITEPECRLGSKH